MGGSPGKKSSSNPQQAKFFQPTVKSWLGLGEEVWGSLRLPLSLRQWGTCWEHPPPSEAVLSPSSLASPMPCVKSSSLQGPSLLSFPHATVSLLRGAALKVFLGQSPEI